MTVTNTACYKVDILNELTVNHRLITINGGFYIGVSKEQDHLSDKYISRPSTE
jgi:hypothetical protein